MANRTRPKPKSRLPLNELRTQSRDLQVELAQLEKRVGTSAPTRLEAARTVERRRAWECMGCGLLSLRRDPGRYCSCPGDQMVLAREVLSERSRRRAVPQ